MSEFQSSTISKTPFGGNILILGCGAICSCALPILLDLVDVDPTKITVLDMDGSKIDNIKSSLGKGVKFLEIKITEDNRAKILETYCSKGDFLLDLAWEIDTMQQLEWCREHGVLYLNTSLEVWNPVGSSFENPHPRDRTLYSRHEELRQMVASWPKNPDNPDVTGMYEHGANPGIVSYLAKRALEDLTKQLLSDPAVDESRKAALKHSLEADDFAKLCMLTGTKVIHISERDTQVSCNPKKPGEFLNTWSIEGYYEEGLQPVEVCWGTHERHLPRGYYKHPAPTNKPPVFHMSKDDNTGHCICLSQPGLRTWGRSYVPGDGGNMIGMLMPHGESVTIGDHLTVLDDEGNIVFRPTVYFVYCPCDDACASMRDVEAQGFKMEGMTNRLMLDDITSGQDKLGVLLLGHDYKAWWTGSLLSIGQSRELVPGQNATSMQVASSAIAGVVWAIRNPVRGVLQADAVPWREVMPVVMPYLGDFHSGPVDWDPLSTRVDLYKGWNTEIIDEEDPWQFCNFMIPGAPSCTF
eukprot:gene3757-7459_t